MHGAARVQRPAPRLTVLCLWVLSVLVAVPSYARDNPFAPLGSLLPPANDIRTASGTPGSRYWQQKVDYRLSATLDEPGRRLSGEGEITYHNRSPQALDHLWLLLDQNRFRPDSLRESTKSVATLDAPDREVARRARYTTWRGGFTINRLEDGAGRSLHYRIVDATMRVDLARPVAPGGTVKLRIAWTLPIIETEVIGGRSGWSCLSDGAGGRESCIFQVGGWFPRLAAFDDEGWHIDPFLGVGEFPLEFGNYDVRLTLPAADVVAATGELQNAVNVLPPEQRRRLARAGSASAPVFIVTPDEAAIARREPRSGVKTWHFRADNVRDFAFAASRAYLWDAMGVRIDAKRAPVLAMSFYPEEARSLWSSYATRAEAHTLRVLSELVLPYPYPIVQASYGPVSGYENPMLSFDAGGTGTDSASGLLSEIVHETGHNWFPELINSDERRYAWMDEGLNTFLEHLVLLRWDPQFPSDNAEPRAVAKCMTPAQQSPIMVRPDDSIDSLCTSYRKPATAFTVLRETVLGREAFDEALRAYARRWQGRRATPADLFRTFHDVTGADLDWFWRGWFSGVDHVDVALTRMTRLSALTNGGNVYRLEFENRGGLITPIPVKLTFAGGTMRKVMIPVQIWRSDPRHAIWTFAAPGDLTAAEIDPELKTGDVDRSNNALPFISTPAPGAASLPTGAKRQ